MFAPKPGDEVVADTAVRSGPFPWSPVVAHAGAVGVVTKVPMLSGNIEVRFDPCCSGDATVLRVNPRGLSRHRPHARTHGHAHMH